MAVTNQDSDQITRKEAGKLNPISDARMDLRADTVSFTQADAAGDATSTVDLVDLPYGLIRLLGYLSLVAFSAFGAARTMDIGWRAYTDKNGDTVVADPNGLASAVDVSAAGTLLLSEALAGALTQEFSSRSGVTIFATISGGTIDVGETIDGTIVYGMA